MPLKVILPLTATFIFCSFIVFSQGTWTRMADFPGTPRYYAVGFSIGTKGYIGTGSDASGYTKDFWEYDSATNTWTRKADFPGTARDGAVGFSIGTKGYIGTGNGTSDFYQYDPATNTWLARANYGGGGMSGSSGFGISSTGKGYLGGSGLDALSNFTKKFYEFSQAANTWTVKTSPPFGIPTSPCLLRYWAAAFSIGTKGYIGSGMGCGAEYFKDFYEYNPATNSWVSRTNFTTNLYGVWNATGFGIGTKGYLFSGEDAAGVMPLDFKEFDQTANTWTARASMPVERQRAVSFSIGTCGYVGTGTNSTGLLNDFWMWCNSVPAPIELLSFSGKILQNGFVQLEWNTATETNNDYFSVERSTDGISFEPIGKIKGAGTSSVLQKYIFTDNNISGSEMIYYYRLLQMDMNGAFDYSNVISVSVSPKSNRLLNVSFIRPSNALMVESYFHEAGDYLFSIIDLSGRTIFQSSERSLKGKNYFPVSLPTCSAGFYFLKISGINTSLHSKFIIE